MSLMEALNAIYDAGSLIGEANNFVFDNFEKITRKEYEQIIDELYRVSIILDTIWSNLERINENNETQA